MKTLIKLKLITLSFLIVSFFGCNDSETENTNSQNPTISIKLVDSPGDFEEVNVNVVDVMIKMDDNDDENGWISLEANSKIINLLDLTGGVNEVLVDKFPIPAGTLKQMRLVLGDGNTIVIKNDADVNETHDLKTPSAQQSGLKLKVDAVIEEGFTYDYIIDFDVKKSIVIAGNSGNIILKPVLYVSTTVTSGSIEGVVSPSDVEAMTSVTDTKETPETEDDEIISAYTDENGQFALWGVPSGTYDVSITPDSESKFTITTVTEVIVVNGEKTIIAPAIELTLKVGSIKGKILNESLTASASIMVDGEAVTVDSDENGEFTLINVPIGTYTVTISAENFTSLEIEALVTENTETVLDNVTLVAVP